VEQEEPHFRDAENESAFHRRSISVSSSLSLSLSLPPSFLANQKMVK